MGRLSAIFVLAACFIYLTNSEKFHIKGKWRHFLQEYRALNSARADDVTINTNDKSDTSRSVISFCQTLECLQIIQLLERQMNNQSFGVYSGRW